jgi:hypothetical protein
MVWPNAEQHPLCYTDFVAAVRKVDVFAKPQDDPRDHGRLLRADSTPLPLPLYGRYPSRSRDSTIGRFPPEAVVSVRVDLTLIRGVTPASGPM